ncbi:carbamoyl phosphate synthase small subunit [Candidatus Kaiserbacteria bacterium RIFCSPHIGHO2_01_FULL_48_10]|uniref:Carbamoyl phosphate synthase small chain n=1 Tax=Candidatus Kaiserbacteria bacterium RIFCSPHIGHO2_01_FULL_48_10 TaxID=1798476 RepID=A0A1F6C295_9BACT|nr:MAG: carbamoyl phosphate synthase small subunit [Candidatus Kaiserbacteria bacterium RIFCSPHIGHO2_01_FULL_48_10]
MAGKRKKAQKKGAIFNGKGKAILTLENGLIFEGQSFGAPITKQFPGEVVFTTGMTGYTESFSDPSYTGQILVSTYPLIGNYGVSERRFFESEKMHIAGLIVSEYSDSYFHHSARQSLADWLIESGVPAITGIDTRALTKVLREKGVMLGRITTSVKNGEFFDPNTGNVVATVSIKKKRIYAGTGPRIILVDCGAKENIVRSLLSHKATVIRVPWDYDFTREKYDGVLISNGPGDPTRCTATIDHLKRAFLKGKPILGICLGTQLMALAAGAKTYKLKYGHRSQNQPCIEEKGSHFGKAQGRCYITSQNHGYAIDEKTLPTGWKVWFRNANDNSVEGIYHATKPFRSVQFHPEACPGPTDTAWVFDEFIKTVLRARKK